MKVGWQRAYDQVVARWPNLDLIKLVRLKPRQGIVAGLVVIAFLLGAMNVALKSSSASGRQDAIDKDRKAKISGSSTHRTCCASPTFLQSLAKPPTRRRGCGSLQRQQWSPDGRTCPRP